MSGSERSTASTLWEATHGSLNNIDNESMDLITRLYKEREFLYDVTDPPYSLSDLSTINDNQHTNARVEADDSWDEAAEHTYRLSNESTTADTQYNTIVDDEDWDGVSLIDSFGHRTARASEDNHLSEQSAYDIYYATNRTTIPFMEDAPEAWFMVLEADFQAAKLVNDDIKYSIVLRALDVETLQLIQDILQNPPPNGKYIHLKDAILSRVPEFRLQKINKLVKNLTLGNKKDDVTDKLVDLGSSYSKLEQKLKDNNELLRACMEEIRDLKDTLLTVKQNIDQMHIDRTRTMSELPVCYYHGRFGDKSYKCLQPCSMNHLI